MYIPARIWIPGGPQATGVIGEMSEVNKKR